MPEMELGVAEGDVWDNRLAYVARQAREIDKEQLRAVLTDACGNGVEISDDDVVWLARRLVSLKLCYSVRKRKQCVGTAASSKLQKLESALKEWLNDKDCDWEIHLLRRRSHVNEMAIRGLADALSETVSFIGSQRKQWPQKNSTSLFVDLYYEYTYQTGKTGLSDSGPAIRFVKTCAKLIDPDILIPDGLRQVIEAGHKRRDSVVG